MAGVLTVEILLTAFGLIVSGLGSVGLWVAVDVLQQLRMMRESVSELNQNIAVIVTRVDSHENRIARLEGN